MSVTLVWRWWGGWIYRIVTRVTSKSKNFIKVAVATVLITHSIVSSRLSLRWRQNGRDSVSNHQPHDCLLNRLFRRRSKKTSKLYVTGLCAGNSPGTGELPAQMASNAENVSTWWRHHDGLINQGCMCTALFDCSNPHGPIFTCLADKVNIFLQANFHRSRAWQIVVILNT